MNSKKYSNPNWTPNRCPKFSATADFLMNVPIGTLSILLIWYVKPEENDKLE